MIRWEKSQFLQQHQKLSLHTSHVRSAPIIGMCQWFPVVTSFSININLLKNSGNHPITIILTCIDESPFYIKATSSGVQIWWSGSRKTFQPACLAPVSQHQSKQFETKYKQRALYTHYNIKIKQTKMYRWSRWPFQISVSLQQWRQPADFVQYDLINSTAQQETLGTSQNSWKLPFSLFSCFWEQS